MSICGSCGSGKQGQNVTKHTLKRVGLHDTVSQRVWAFFLGCDMYYVQIMSLIICTDSPQNILILFYLAIGSRVVN